MLSHNLIHQFEKEIEQFSDRIKRTKELLSGEIDCDVATTPADIVLTRDKMKMYHYKPAQGKQKIHSPPVLIVYALINRYIMLDLEPGRSFIQNLINGGLDVYLIDWDYPDGADRYLTMGDYINYYIDEAVDWIRQESNSKRINMMGICMGGTFSLIYSALHQEKIKNLATFASPVETDIDDGILFLWAKKINADKVLQALGNLPGRLSNLLYMLAVPVGSVDKYIQFFEKSDDPEFLRTFLRMEKWSFDTPDMPGEVFRQYIEDIFQKNLLIKNKMVIDGETVDLKKISCPLLNVFGTKDYIVPPSSAKPLSKAIGSKDVTNLEINTGHISMFMGKCSGLEVTPKVVEWIKER